MKLKSASCLAAATMLFSAPAFAGLLFDPYIGATGGVGGATILVDHDHKSYMATSLGGVVGVDIPFVRAEGEYDYIHLKDAKAHAAMGNLYLKMPTPMVAPYIGGGVGAIFDGGVDNGPQFDTTTAYQAMLGLTFKIPVLPFNIDTEARALYAHDLFKMDDGEKVNLVHYDIRAKIRFIF